LLTSEQGQIESTLFIDVDMCRKEQDKVEDDVNCCASVVKRFSAAPTNAGPEVEVQNSCSDCSILNRGNVTTGTPWVKFKAVQILQKKQ